MRRKPSARGPVAAGPRRAFVDSSGWIALISADDTNHVAADGVFRRAIARRVSLVTTNLVLAEVHRLLLHRVGIRAASAALARMEASPAVSLQFTTRDHHEAARRWLTKLSDQTITYTDAVSFAVAHATSCDVVIGFDSDFVVAGFVPWRAP